MNLKTKFKQMRWLMIIGLIYIIYLCLDYFNVPSKCLMLNMNNINSDFNNDTITVLLFGIAYFTIDRINAVKNHNQREIVKHLIIKTCDRCVNNASFIRDNKQNIINSYNNNKQKIDKYVSLPFAHDEDINAFVKNGYLSLEEYNCFKAIKEDYDAYIKEEIEPIGDMCLSKEYFSFLENDVESLKNMFEKQ